MVRFVVSTPDFLIKINVDKKSTLYVSYNRLYFILLLQKDT